MAPCVVCDERDRRALVEAALPGGAVVSLCGTHELMHRRAGDWYPHWIYVTDVAQTLFEVD